MPNRFFINAWFWTYDECNRALCLVTRPLSGIIVDDAIVVIEIHRLLHQHPEWSTQAAKYAAGGSFLFWRERDHTCTFLSFTFWPRSGYLCALLLTLIITLGASLFVAFVMNPVFAVSFMKREEGHHFVTVKDMRAWIIAFIAIAVVGYLSRHFGIANFAVVVALFMLLHIFVLQYAIASFQRESMAKVFERI